MKTKKIYLIRHGQTEFNKLGIVQGSGVDTSLNETGKKQADSFFKDYKEFPFDKVYTSYLKRSIESVQSFIGLGVPHERLEGLNEINWGCKEGKSFNDEDHTQYLTMIKAWQEGRVDLCIDGGESPSQVQARLKKTLTYILDQKEEEKILICMHGRAMRVFLCLMLNYELKFMDFFAHDNLCLYQLSYTGSLFSIEKFNNREHLDRLQLTVSSEQ